MIHVLSMIIKANVAANRKTKTLTTWPQKWVSQLLCRGLLWSWWEFSCTIPECSTKHYTETVQVANRAPCSANAAKPNSSFKLMLEFHLPVHILTASLVPRLLTRCLPEFVHMLCDVNDCFPSADIPRYIVPSHAANWSMYFCCTTAGLVAMGCSASQILKVGNLEGDCMILPSRRGNYAALQY